MKVMAVLRPRHRPGVDLSVPPRPPPHSPPHPPGTLQTQHLAGGTSDWKVWQKTFFLNVRGHFILSISLFLDLQPPPPPHLCNTQIVKKSKLELYTINCNIFIQWRLVFFSAYILFVARKAAIPIYGGTSRAAGIVIMTPSRGIPALTRLQLIT